MLKFRLTLLVTFVRTARQALPQCFIRMTRRHYFWQCKNMIIWIKISMAFRTLKLFFNDLVAFIKNVSTDSRIPERDKVVVIALVALLASPFDIIPDWIPIFGMMDDIVMLALILDYFFNVLDQQILLSHYPWGMKSYSRVRNAARLIALITPQMIKSKLWQYRPDPY